MSTITTKKPNESLIITYDKETSKFTYNSMIACSLISNTIIDDD